MAFSTLILAAGAGTRMKSKKAKVTHELLGKPMIRWVVDAAYSAGSSKIITIVGHEYHQVLAQVKDTTVVVQEEQLGTGHAIMIAQDILAKDLYGSSQDSAGELVQPQVHTDAVAQPNLQASSLVVLCGDTPLITAGTISELVGLQQSSGAAVCVLTHLLEDPTNYGRIVRSKAGDVLEIVEEKDATEQQRKIKECNSGAYCFDVETLLEALPHLSCDNAQGEYYLTDIISICAKRDLVVKAHVVDAEETQGINNRLQLAMATKSAQRRINEEHMLNGVTMIDPESVWIDPDVELENDVELLPLTMIYGDSHVQSGSVIGPNTRIVDSKIGRDCRVDESVILSSVLEEKVSCGPRAYLRPGTHMLSGSKAGTHVEIKNSTIGEGSKVPHLSYFGDATLGKDVNIGAGSISCNYDGTSKNATIIGDRSFVGSDTMLVAPVQIGSDVTIGAGSVITKNVPDGALAVERADQTMVEGWTLRRKGLENI